MIYQMHQYHGRHIAYNGLEAEANRKSGWKDVTEAEFYASQKIAVGPIASVETEAVAEASQEVEETGDEDRETAAAAYELKFGKKPHHRMGTDTILKALDDDCD